MIAERLMTTNNVINNSKGEGKRSHPTAQVSTDLQYLLSPSTFTPLFRNLHLSLMIVIQVSLSHSLSLSLSRLLCVSSPLCLQRRPGWVLCLGQIGIWPGHYQAWGGCFQHLCSKGESRKHISKHTHTHTHTHTHIHMHTVILWYINMHAHIKV